MRKLILFTLMFFTLVFCNNNSKVQTDHNNETETVVISKAESDQKLIEACENMDGIVDADIKDDILTVRANISKIEAQKLSDGMLVEIKKYNNYINTVMVVDLEYHLLGYSGK